MKLLAKELTTEPVHCFSLDRNVKEQIGDSEDVFIREMAVEIAFAYNSTSDNMIGESFCNDIFNIDNGVHYDSAFDAVKKYLIYHTKKSLNDTEMKEMNIITSDVMSGLTFIISLSTDFNPGFEGQTKVKVGNPLLAEHVSRISTVAVTEFFATRPKLLKKYIDRIKRNGKARLAATKAKASIIKDNTDSLSDYRSAKFTPANNKGKNQYRELIILEGDSALGSAKSGRYSNDTQALFAIKGVPNNGWNMSLNDVHDKIEFRQLVEKLGCNIGTKFDITKLKYNKIIIMTDADSDGFNITSLLCAFFIKHMPELVEAGVIFKVLPPLYEIKDKTKKFILDKGEYLTIFEHNVCENLAIVNEKGRRIDKGDFKDILVKNRDYADELMRVASHFAVHPTVIEFIALHHTKPNFEELISGRFSEMEVDDNTVAGIYEGRFQLVVIDGILINKLNRLSNIIHDVNGGDINFNIVEVANNKIVNKLGNKTLGELMILCQKFKPVILTRFKGLGELNALDLKNTSMNPNNRILVNLTVADMFRTLNIFRMLHGDLGDDAERRKEFMQGTQLSRDELDN